MGGSSEKGTDGSFDLVHGVDESAMAFLAKPPHTDQLPEDPGVVARGHADAAGGQHARNRVGDVIQGRLEIRDRHFGFALESES